MGGGGGGSKPKPQAAPPQAQPIDYNAIMGQSSKAAKEQYRDQLAAQIEAYPKMERLQLGTIEKVATKLSAPRNLYTQRATDQLIAAGQQADDLQSVADYTDQLGYTAAGDLQGTDIERELQRQATGELALGRSLTPEQERMAQQSARAGMSARGLGTGTGALAAEVLNREMFASQREADRRNFAGSTNQMLVGNRQARIGQVGNILGQSANTRMNQANLRSSLAGANVTIDPYSRAMNPALGMSASTLGNSGQMIGNTYNNATQMAGNVASFNANMLDTRYNSYQNNQAALRGAQIQAGAANQAGMMGMLGSLGGGGMAAAGSIGGAVILGGAI